jgi:outer membrane biosynthesis protein TonB
VPERVVPQRKPKPPKRQPQTARAQTKPTETFDADRVSQLINRTSPSGGGSGAARASIGAETGRASAALTMSELDALRAKMQACWTPPIGLANAQELVVTLTISLAPDGTVSSIDNMQVPGIGAIYDAAADAARRAVLQCQPYSPPLTAEKYESWKDVQVNFDPRSLF